MNHNKATATKKTETARAAYHRNQREIGAALEAIAKACTEDAFKKPLDEMNWADVGSLAKVNTDLQAVLAFLTK